MIASLTVYEWPETHDASQQLWQGLRDAMRGHGIDAPDEVTREICGLELCRHPELLFAQTCGYPYMTELRGKTRLVATPHYAAEGCEGPAYCSWIVVHKDADAQSLADLRGTVAAYNGSHSQSGYNTFRAAIAPLADAGQFFAGLVESGGHGRSLELVAAREAYCAAIDAVSWAMVSRYQPDLAAEVRAIAKTPSAPSLPFVTAATRSRDEVGAIRAALFDVLEDPELGDARDMFLLTGATVLGDEDYEICLEMEADAARQGFPELA
ncbi:MAG: PhnD/SsuA/transferrin family substrate-binding protein [Hyphomicrobiaceae bacterium]